MDWRVTVRGVSQHRIGEPNREEGHLVGGGVSTDESVQPLGLPEHEIEEGPVEPIRPARCGVHHAVWACGRTGVSV